MTQLAVIRKIIENWEIFIIIAVIAIISVFLMYHHISSKDLDKRYNNIVRRVKVIFGLPIQHKIDALSKIAKNSTKYQKSFDVLNAQYKDLIDNEFFKIKEQLNNVNRFRIKRDYQNTSKAIGLVLQSLEITELKANQINSELDELRKVEKLQKVTISKIKEYWSKLRNEYSLKLVFLKDYAKQLDNVIKQINDKFVLIDQCIKNGDNEESRMIIDSVESQMVEFAKAIEFIPNMSTYATKVAPKKIIQIGELLKNHEKANEIFRNFDYSKISSNLTKMSQEVINKISNNKINEAVDLCNKLSRDIDFTFKAIYAEEKAYEIFEQDNLAVVRSYEDLITAFSEIEPEIKKTVNSGKLGDSELATVIELKHAIKKLRTMGEKYFEATTSSRNKYTFVEQIKNLNYFVSLINEAKDLFQKQLSLLEEKTVASQRASVSVRELNLALIQIENQIINSQLTFPRKKYLSFVNSIKGRVDDISNQIANDSETIEAINKTIAGIKEELANLMNAVNSQFKAAVMAEKAIVFANRFRSQNATYEKILSAADVEYKAGNFTSALGLAIDILEQEKPGSSKKLGASNE